MSTTSGACAGTGPTSRPSARASGRAAAPSRARRARTTCSTRTGPTACGNRCPLPYHVLKISTDGGATWGVDHYLCACQGVKGQFDPEIEVVPNTGAVYAAWMNSNTVVFSKSTDHGQTWSTPVSVLGKVSWSGGHSGNVDEVVMGNGSARLDVEVVMGHAQVRVGSDRQAEAAAS